MKVLKTVILIDDDESVRKATGRLLRSEGYEVVSFASADEFLAKDAFEHPCCLVLDYHMPGLNGLELQEELIKSERLIPIVFITGHADIPISVKAMKHGAVDFLPKPFKSEALFDAVEKALQRSQQIQEDLKQKESTEKIFRVLTPAEQTVMRWVITGMLNKQIADKLGITEKTVKAHRGAMMHKLQITSVAELVRLTQKAEITPLAK